MKTREKNNIVETPKDYPTPDKSFVREFWSALQYRRLVHMFEAWRDLATWWRK